MKKLSVAAGKASIAPLMLTLMSMVLLMGRMLYLGSNQFIFMLWNLFLAWLPLLWGYLLKLNLKKEKFQAPKNLLLAALFLAFLPNAFYLVTDFIHLWSSSPRSLLYDAVMFMSFALTGLVLGCMSVYIIDGELRKHLKSADVWKVLAVIFLLNGFAIYMGRHLRWNSWDLVTNPLFIMLDLTNRLSSIDTFSVTMGVTLLFAGFIGVVYAAFYFGIKSLKASK